MKKNVKYYAVLDLKKVVCTTQRVASVSMVEALAPAHEHSDVEAISVEGVKSLAKIDWPVLLWVRNPFERLASAYLIFGRTGLSFTDFLQRAMSETNPHWSPLTQLHTHGKFLPTTVYAFEHLAITWANELPGYELKHWDKSVDRTTWGELQSKLQPDMLERVWDFWKNDEYLHGCAVKNGPLGLQVAA